MVSSTVVSSTVVVGDNMLTVRRLKRDLVDRRSNRTCIDNVKEVDDSFVCTGHCVNEDTRMSESPRHVLLLEVACSKGVPVTDL
jgi:hypothetical protein